MTTYRIVLDHTSPTTQAWYRLEKLVDAGTQSERWSYKISGRKEDIQRVVDRLRSNGGLEDEIVNVFTIPEKTNLENTQELPIVGDSQ